MTVSVQLPSPTAGIEVVCVGGGVREEAWVDPGHRDQLHLEGGFLHRRHGRQHGMCSRTGQYSPYITRAGGSERGEGGHAPHF